jgi:gluconokinase
MIILVMGVSGSGKTTIAQMLADSLHWQFQDADDFHPQENIQKMRQGIPLDDDDRKPWLQILHSAIALWLHNHDNVVLACSALKASYRQMLVFDTNIKQVYLKGSFELIQKRLQQRQNHFMSAKLLKSQFDSLQEPCDALIVDVSKSPQAIVNDIRESWAIY